MGILINLYLSNLKGVIDMHLIFVIYCYFGHSLSVLLVQFDCSDDDS